MPHLKSNKLKEVPLNGTRTVLCYPELKFGFIEDLDDNYIGYGWHFYTDENGDRKGIRVGENDSDRFERPISKEELIALEGMTNTTGMNADERRYAVKVTGARAILTQDGYFGLTGADYEEVIHQENEQE